MARSTARRFAGAGLLRRPGTRWQAGGGGPTPTLVWDDLTALPGWTFSRSTVATDGAPSCGLPADDVDDYAIDVIREVSAKLGLSSQPAYLLEGARTNHTIRSEQLDNTGFWTTTGTVTRTGSIADPSGGTTAARLQTAAGANFANASTSGVTTVPTTCSWFVQQGPGTGAWQATVLNPVVARGGTAVAWQRPTWTLTPAAASLAWRAMESVDRSANGGVTAGARDAVLWGVQTETGAFASSYIRSTAGSATTRAVDNARLTLPAAWCSDVLVVEYRPEHSSAEFVTAGTTRRLIDDGTARLSIVLDSGACKAQLITSGGTYLSPALTYSAGDVVRIDVDWSALELDVSVDGTPVVQTAITGAWASGGTAYIGRNSGGTETAMGVISIGGIR